MLLIHFFYFHIHCIAALIIYQDVLQNNDLVVNTSVLMTAVKRIVAVATNSIPVNLILISFLLVHYYDARLAI